MEDTDIINAANEVTNNMAECYFIRALILSGSDNI
jgi:hypothetical protein